MPPNADRRPAKESHPAVSALPKGQTADAAAIQFPDNRPVAVAQRKIQQIANNSLQVKQLATMQQMADGRLQGVAQMKGYQEEEPVQKKGNSTGLPDTLKSGIEHLSGMDISDVKVHYNSAQPAQLNALAFAQGTDIHVGPGQEKHLPHEAWHIVQQKQGRVKPTMQMKEMPVDDNTHQFVFQLVPDPRIYQLVSAEKVAQLIYLFDRSPGSDDKKPRWSEEKKPPFSYIRSGIHNDGEHGPDALYERLAGHDLFYGIAYEDSKEFQEFQVKLQAIAKENSLEYKEENIRRIVGLYEEKGGITTHEARYCQHIFGGSSGWDQHQKYLATGESKKSLADRYQELNPDLLWGKDPSSRGCQAAMIGAIENGGSVRFMLNGMNDVGGIILGTAHTSKITSNELKFAHQILGRAVKVTADKVIHPVEMQNVFFYVNRVLVNSTRMASLSNAQTSGAAPVEEEKVPVPPGKGKKPSKFKCYITTACTEFMGLGDDCEELTVLRYFRDNYLLQKQNGPALIELYYKYSPAITDEINKRKDKDEILKKLYGIIKQCVVAIKLNDNEFAFNTYCKMVMELKAQFIPVKSGHNKM